MMDVNLYICDAYIEEEYIWCIAMEDAYLYRINRTTNIMEQIIPLQEQIYMKGAFEKILSYGEKFVFVPRMADEVVVLDRKTLEITRIELPKIKVKVGTGDSKFCTGIIYDSTLFMFGYNYVGIISIDLNTYKMDVIDEWYKSVEKELYGKTDGCFHKSYVQVDGTIYMPFMNLSAIVQFDMNSRKATIHKYNNESQGYIYINETDEGYVLIPRNAVADNVIVLDKKLNISKEIVVDKCYLDEQESSFYNTVVIDDNILIFAHLGNNNISIDMTTGVVKIFSHLYDINNIKIRYVKACKYPVVIKDGNYIFFIVYGLWGRYDFRNNKICSYEYKYAEDIIERYKRDNIINYVEECKGVGTLFENDKYDLNSIICYLKII